MENFWIKQLEEIKTKVENVRTIEEVSNEVEDRLLDLGLNIKGDANSKLNALKIADRQAYNEIMESITQEKNNVLEDYNICVSEQQRIFIEVKEEYNEALKLLELYEERLYKEQSEFKNKYGIETQNEEEILEELNSKIESIERNIASEKEPHLKAELEYKFKMICRDKEDLLETIDKRNEYEADIEYIESNYSTEQERFKENNSKAQECLSELGINTNEVYIEELGAVQEEIEENLNIEELEKDDAEEKEIEVEEEIEENLNIEELEKDDAEEKEIEVEEEIEETQNIPVNVDNDTIIINSINILNSIGKMDLVNLLKNGNLQKYEDAVAVIKANEDEMKTEKFKYDKKSGEYIKATSLWDKWFKSKKFENIISDTRLAIFNEDSNSSNKEKMKADNKAYEIFMMDYPDEIAEILLNNNMDVEDLSENEKIKQMLLIEMRTDIDFEDNNKRHPNYGKSDKNLNYTKKSLGAFKEILSIASKSTELNKFPYDKMTIAKMYADYISDYDVDINFDEYIKTDKVKRKFNLNESGKTTIHSQAKQRDEDNNIKDNEIKDER